MNGWTQDSDGDGVWTLSVNADKVPSTSLFRFIINELEWPDPQGDWEGVARVPNTEDKYNLVETH